MIRLANIDDLTTVSEMMMAMYIELMPTVCSRDLHDYRVATVEHLTNPKEWVYIAEGGFFVVRDETEAVAPLFKRYNGVRVYIQPEHRHTSLLARFYKRLFADFPEGEILGMTEINSEHIKVLDKRHDLIAKVYKLRRR